MGEQISLQGSCSCGRYHYVVMIPENDASQLQLHFATDHENRRSTSSLLTSYLRIPLLWYSSRTLALFPDETHNSISRTFVPPHAPHSQRKFCGYCGTHLSYWTEEPPSEQEYLKINVGSLLGRDLEILEQLGVLDDSDESNKSEDLELAPTNQPQEAEDDVTEIEQHKNGVTTPARSIRQGRVGDLSWFEEMIDGSRLGKTSRTTKGHGQNADGTTTISWEVSEFTDGDFDSAAESSIAPSTRAKRKIDDVATDNDTTMT